MVTVNWRIKAIRTRVTPTDGLKHEHSATFISEHHIWDVEKVNAFVANQEEAVTFFCGGSKNSSKYIDVI